MILKGIALTAGALGAYKIGKNAAKKEKAAEDRKLNKKIAQHLATARNVRMGRV